MRAARGRGAAALLAAVVGGLLAGAGPAAASVTPGEWWNGAYEGYCLAGDDAGRAFLGECDGTPNQRWNSPTLEGEPGSVGAVFAMQNKATGECLTGAADGGVTTAACTYDDTQGWVGGSLLVNRATGLCVAAESPTELRQVTCDPEYLHDDQRWYPAEVGP
ncbi:RICIN domain-containing protein [Streptomyces odontomachi]|uniref:RICIN domain-containing protein n=1 Tax=Streptomyces odontomachi TaxID=2944940 RepID=UPI00210A880C|nr:hypothetical protein [Streptomyces sp. ODS25]